MTVIFSISILEARVGVLILEERLAARRNEGKGRGRKTTKHREKETKSLANADGNGKGTGGGGEIRVKGYKVVTINNGKLL